MSKLKPGSQWFSFAIERLPAPYSTPIFLGLAPFAGKGNTKVH
jgi:hypothetical protein